MARAIDKAQGFDHKLGPVPDPQRDPPPLETGRAPRAKRGRLLHLSLREYLPLLATVGLWAVILVAMGHADTARLLAANVMLRAIQMLTRLSTAQSVKSRIPAPAAVRRQARRKARTVQAGVLGIRIMLLLALILGLEAIGQKQIAMFLPLVAVGMPAHVLRFSDVRTNSPYFRLALSAGGLVLALGGWAAGLGAVGMGLAFGMREWLAYAVVRIWPKSPAGPARPILTRLGFAEIARNTALSGRRLLTYRITKVALTIFGPLGNFAARTGRGLNWHKKIEPWLPHRLSGFILFAGSAAAGAVALAMGSGEPAAMIGAAGLMQLAGASANIALLWKYLPDLNDPALRVDDDDED